MRIIRPRLQNISRYATLNRPHYICPECKIHIVRDREEDMFLCLQCGRKETRAEFRQTLIANVAAFQEDQKRKRQKDARWERLQRNMRSVQDDKVREQFSVVYYIQMRDLIKIGTTTDLRVRMSALPWERLLLTEPGWYRKEHERHHQFADLKYDGEWFRADDPLMEFIAERRAELEEHNRKRYGDRPPFPWVKREVSLPSVRDMADTMYDEIDWGDAIEVEEIEYSGRYYCNDRDDEVRI